MTAEGETTTRPDDQTGQHNDILNPVELMAADTNSAETHTADGPPSKRLKMAESIVQPPAVVAEYHATSTTDICMSDISMGEATVGPANGDTAGLGGPGGPRGNSAGEDKAKVAEAPTPVESEKRARVRGVAPIKAEYLIPKPKYEPDNLGDGAAQDDAAEGREANVRGNRDGRDNRDSRDNRDYHNRDRHDTNGRHDKKKRERGQNKERHFGRTADIIRLCPTRAFHPEFSPAHCSFGDGCRYGHDLREYLEAGRREDSATATFCGGPCPVFEKFGKCYSGWKCRFVKSHMSEVEHEDGRKELVLVDNTVPKSGTTNEEASGGSSEAIVPVGDSHEGATETTGSRVPAPTEAPVPGHEMNDKEGVAEGPGRDQDVISVNGDQEPTAAEATTNGEDSAKNSEDSAKDDKQKAAVELDKDTKAPPKDETAKKNRGRGDGKPAAEMEDIRPDLVNSVPFRVKVELSRRRVDFSQTDEYIKWMVAEAKLSDTFHTRRKNQNMDGIEDLRAAYVDPPALPSEKRRLYFGPETAVLAPLTTQGNIPFRRLCVELGAQLTYSEMAMSVPLLQGAKADWPLLRAHRSETAPPRFSPASPDRVPAGYDNSRDLKFGAQISASAPWAAIKAADVLNRYCPHLRLIDLNCGCPIDMIFNAGGGSALLDAPAKMERMIRGMNVMSGEIPITAKIRTGVRTGRPVVSTILGKLAFGSREHRDRLGAPGCAAVTLHGRSREMRYTRQADWEYIAECASVVKAYNQQSDRLLDTAAEPDARTQPAAGRLFFLGNGDCFSHEDYYGNIRETGVDSVMIGRGALVKPWIFEEIDKGQYLDKTSTQRLEYVEKFARYGLEAWGSDEVGVGYTRRFLLEWLSFHHRYVPVGLLEHLPPSLNDRPPAYKGRDDMETLLSSANYRDWIKISEMYLGPVHPDFHFQPKHKSNTYEAEG